jgi:uncharacterized protein (DUF983 family)
VVKQERRSPIKILGRSLRLRCPACGQSSIIQKPFHIKHHCSSCNTLFKREAGFFVGAIMANVIATEAVILAVYAFCLPLMANNYRLVLTILFILALIFPLAFYHHSWALWLGLDHLIESLPKVDSKRP